MRLGHFPFAQFLFPTLPIRLRPNPARSSRMRATTPIRIRPLDPALFWRARVPAQPLPEADATVPQNVLRPPMSVDTQVLGRMPSPERFLLPPDQETQVPRALCPRSIQ